MARKIPHASPEQIDLIRTLFAEREIPQGVGFAAEFETALAAETVNVDFASTLITAFKRQPYKKA